jgi:hypothetical protein
MRKSKIGLGRSHDQSALNYMEITQCVWAWTISDGGIICVLRCVGRGMGVSFQARKPVQHGSEKRCSARRPASSHCFRHASGALYDRIGSHPAAYPSTLFHFHR